MDSVLTLAEFFSNLNDNTTHTYKWAGITEAIKYTIVGRRTQGAAECSQKELERMNNEDKGSGGGGGEREGASLTLKKVE